MSKKKRNKSNKNTNTQTKKSPQDKQAAKKAMVLGEDKKNNLPFIVGVVVAIIVIGAAVYFAAMKTGGSGPVATSDGYAETTSSSSVTTYPVADFADGKARHYSYKASSGLVIKYFIIKSSDGIIRAAYDACDVCWPEGKGYYQDGDVMVCRNCGRRFASVLVNEVKGGCNPAPLKRTIEGDNVIITVKDILDGKQYFDFSKRS